MRKYNSQYKFKQYMRLKPPDKFPKVTHRYH